MEKKTSKRKTTKRVIDKKVINEEVSIKLTNREFILVVLIGIVLGAGLTLLAFKPNNSLKGYQKVDKNLQSIIDSYNSIINDYYKDVDANDLTNGAVKGMLEAIGDPYTTYMDSTEYSNFLITLNGSYEGLGVEISKFDNDIAIVGIFEDSPAAKAGLELGDIIVSIDDLKGDEITTPEFSAYVRNSDKSTFKIVVNRNGEEKTFKIKREKVVLKSVTSKVMDKNGKKVGYISLSVFASNSYSQFKENLTKLEKQGIDALIIDLRDNTGGELTNAANIISLFLDNDKVIYQMQTKNGAIEKTYSTGKKDKEYPIVILTNNATASASEVVAAALRDNLGAKIIGEKTYGKGTAQTMLNLDTGEQYKLTTKKWLTPKGEWINEVGLTPDIEVSLGGVEDSQIDAAIKYLTENKES